MKSLVSSPAVIVDDRYDEVRAVIRALGKEGIGVRFIQGDNPQELPGEGEGIPGMRLLFLDVELGLTTDSSPDGAMTISSLMGVLSRLIPTPPAPVLIILWTKHYRLLDAFTEKVRAEYGPAQADLVIGIEKSLDKDKVDDGDYHEKYADNLFGEIKGKLEENKGLDVLWGWERVNYDATTTVTNHIWSLSQELAKHSTESDESRTLSPVESLFLLVGKLMRAHYEAHLPQDSECVHGLLHALSPVITDRAQFGDHSHITNSDGWSGVLEKARQLTGKTELDKIVSSVTPELNRQILLANPENSPKSPVAPGEIYIAKSIASEHQGVIFDKQGRAESDFITDFIQGKNPDSTVVKEYVETFSYPLLIEVTPACDHAQLKAKLPRFVSGLLIPKNKRNKVNERAGHITCIGPIEISEEEVNDLGLTEAGAYCLVINAHFIFGVSRNKLEGVQAWTRVRGDALRDLIAQISAHSARPGYFYL